MPSFSLLQQRTLQIAKGYLGQKEATGRNDGWLPRLVQHWVANGAAYMENQPWCVMFALYCVHNAAKELGLKSGLPKTASSSALYRWFKSKGLLLDRPVPGCIGMVRGGRTGHSHTFLVHDVKDGEVIGVDGNWKNAVRFTHRPIDACDYGPIL